MALGRHDALPVMWLEPRPMTRPTDPRGADRRKPSTFGAETGYDVDAPGKARTQHKPRRVVPDHGCHGYDLRGTMFTRCQAHAPTGGRDLGAVLGACVACSAN